MGVLSQRQLFVTVATSLVNAGEKEKALEILDLCQKCVPEENFPLETIPAGFTTNDYMVVRMIEMYYMLNEREKAAALAERIAGSLLETMNFYARYASLGRPEFESSYQCLYYLEDVLEEYKDVDIANKIADDLSAMIKSMGAGLEN